MATTIKKLTQADIIEVLADQYGSQPNKVSLNISGGYQSNDPRESGAATVTATVEVDDEMNFGTRRRKDRYPRDMLLKPAGHYVDMAAKASKETTPMRQLAAGFVNGILREKIEQAAATQPGPRFAVNVPLPVFSDESSSFVYECGKILAELHFTAEQSTDEMNDTILVGWHK